MRYIKNLIFYKNNKSFNFHRKEKSLDGVDFCIFE